MIETADSALINNHDLPSTGWLGKLSLLFENRTVGNNTVRTELIERKQQGPLTVQRPFYPEGHPCHLYLLHPPGGLVGGDSLQLDIHLSAKSHLLMTMPGATKFYRTVANTAFIKQNFTLSEESILEWLPQETIFFTGAKAAIKTQFNLAKGSRLLGWETLCFGRPVMGEQFEQGNINSRLSINIPDEIGLDEHLKIIDGNCESVGDYSYSATLFAYPTNKSLLQQVQEFLLKKQIPAGATCLEQLMIVRLLANDNLICQEQLHQLWSLLRPQIINLPPCPPRIWAT